MEKLEGSGWHVKHYHTLFIEVYKIKEAREHHTYQHQPNILLHHAD
jgi:hypothetical protein